MMPKFQLIFLFIGVFFTNGLYAESKCKEFVKCIACGGKEEIKEWTIRNTKLYGDASQRIEMLKKDMNSNESDYPKLKKEFFRSNGAYLYFLLSGDSELNPLKLTLQKYLLSKGVHPYDSWGSNLNVVTLVVLEGDVSAFKIILDSSKLLDCDKEFNKLKAVIRKNENIRFRNVFKKYIEKHKDKL